MIVGTHALVGTTINLAKCPRGSLGANIFFLSLRTSSPLSVSTTPRSIPFTLLPHHPRQRRFPSSASFAVSSFRSRRPSHPSKCTSSYKIYTHIYILLVYNFRYLLTYIYIYIVYSYIYSSARTRHCCTQSPSAWQVACIFFKVFLLYFFSVDICRFSVQLSMNLKLTRMIYLEWMS